MARFIIDDENISIDNLAKLEKLSEKDKIYIVTNNRQKLSISVLAWFLAKKIKIKIILLESAHKDYADKIITFLMGKLSHKKGKIFIVSNDKFYDDVIEFFNKKDKNGGKFYKLKFDFNRSQTAQMIEENHDEIAVLIRNSGSLSELHMKFISKFGSKNGADVYNAVKEDARKIYKKPQNTLLENPQKREMKRIASPNSLVSAEKNRDDTDAKTQCFNINEKKIKDERILPFEQAKLRADDAKKGLNLANLREKDGRECDERETAQTRLNLYDDNVLRAQNDTASEANLDNGLQKIQISQPKRSQSLACEAGLAARRKQIFQENPSVKIEIAESNSGDEYELQDGIGRMKDEKQAYKDEKTSDTEANLRGEADIEAERLGDATEKSNAEQYGDKKPQISQNKRATQKSKSQNDANKTEPKNYAQDSVKTSFALKIDEDVKQEIRKIAFESKNLGDFHNGLVKKYGAQAAGELYKALKQKAKEYLSRRDEAVAKS